MQKTSKIDWRGPAQYGAGGLLLGAGGMSVLEIIRMIKQQQRDKKVMTAPEQTNEDAIVLTLPAKHAEKLDSAIKHYETTESSTKKGPATTSQYRRYDGTMGYKTATWDTTLASWIAATGGVGLGAAGVHSIMQQAREKALQKKVEAAKQEYLDMLSTGKTAASFDAAFDIGLGDKQALFGIGGTVDTTLAVSALLAILGTGGVAYLTKKILDERAYNNATAGLEVPKIKRVVFRTAPSATEGGQDPAVTEREDMPANEADAQKLLPSAAPALSVPLPQGGVKVASAEDMENVKFALAVYLDYLDSESRIFTDPEVKRAMDDSGVTIRQLYKAASDTATAMPELLKIAQGLPAWTRNLAVDKMYANHPVAEKYLSWTKPLARGIANLPGIRDQVDTRIKGYASGQMGDWMAKIKASLMGWWNKAKGFYGQNIRPLFEAAPAAPAQPVAKPQGNLPGQRMPPAIQPYYDPAQWSPNKPTQGNIVVPPKPPLQSPVPGAPGGMIAQGSAKAAQVVPREILTSMIGTTLGRKPVDADAIARAVVRAQAEQRAQPVVTPEQTAADVNVSGADPEAQAYVEKNKAKIRALLVQLAAQGKI
jgi:hypothetical protein